jgi:hypothetical protein
MRLPSNDETWLENPAFSSMNLSISQLSSSTPHTPRRESGSTMENNHGAGFSSHISLLEGKPHQYPIILTLLPHSYPYKPQKNNHDMDLYHHVPPFTQIYPKHEPFVNIAEWSSWDSCDFGIFPMSGSPHDARDTSVYLPGLVN